MYIICDIFLYFFLERTKISRKEIGRIGKPHCCVFHLLFYLHKSFFLNKYKYKCFIVQYNCTCFTL